MKKVVILFCAIIFLHSCKENENKQKNVTEVVNKTESRLAIEIDYRIDKTEKIQCVFSDIELSDNNQNGAYIITEEFKPKPEFHTAKYIMFGDFIPLKLQLRLGNSPINLRINKIIVMYEDNEVIVNGKDFGRYFVMNKYVKFNDENNTLETIKVNGLHKPVITFRRGFINKLFDLR